MRASLRWLSEYVDLPSRDPEEVGGLLAGLGHEVEAIEAIEAPFRGVVVARVTERKPHPNADRLQLVRVDTGSNQVEVVCGAWNFEEGALVPYAPPGSSLAEGLEVGERDIRGVSSPGMICSEAELGLGEDHSGILLLGAETPVGRDFADLLPFPDTVLDLSITPNRPDCMSMVGLARDLAARLDREVRIPETTGLGEAETGARVRIEDPEGCPRYVAREVEGVSVGPSPIWLQLRLRAGGIRPINNVVDVTNYVLLELGQPLHAFDQDRLADETIVVRRAEEGERLETLDGVERVLNPEDVVIADAERAVALGGVMGGEETEVGPETTRVLIESAHFSPPRVMLTAKRHGLRTEASARFERGVDPEGARRAADRAAELMVEVAGGAVAGVRDAYPRPVRPVRVELPAREVPRLLGIDPGTETVASYLRRLGLEVAEGEPMEVTVPTFRPDLTRAADLVEEVARLHGYDRIPETLPSGTGGGLPVRERRLRRVRSLMEGAGYHEAQTLSFLGQADLDRLGLATDDERRSGIPVVNPLREEEGVLRTTLLPGLLKAVAYNRSRRLGDVALFEVGTVFLPGGGDLPDQPLQLAFIGWGAEAGGPHEEPRQRDVFDATGLWEALAAGLGIEDATIRSASRAPFHPVRAGEVSGGGEPLGMVGELHPRVVRAFDLEGRVVAGELAVAPFLDEPTWRQLEEPSVFPPVVFDLAFEMDVEVPAAELVAVVREAAGRVLESVRIFDVFEGEPLPEGHKSLALRLTCRAPDHTLTDEEVGPVRERIAAAVAERLGGRLRGSS